VTERKLNHSCEQIGQVSAAKPRLTLIFRQSTSDDIRNIIFPKL
jgi:hypothetical protein